MDSNSSIFVQAKIEYTKQLINTLKPHMYDGIKSIYDDAKELYRENSSTSLLFIFRTLLEKIPEWNNELIVNETDRIMDCSKCDWLDELVTAVYISHTKILMSIGSNNNNKINLTIPKLINFIHKCYINIARELWKNPLLFSESISGFEYQKNIQTIETIICDCIENTIRISLPVKEILKEHLDIYDNKSSDNKSTSDSKLLNELKELLMNKELKEGLNNTEDNNDEDDDDNERINIVSESEESKDKSKEEFVVVDKDSEDTVEENTSERVDDVEKENPVNIFENKDGYESPDEETIKKNCENIQINDIPDIKVDGSITTDVKEPVYDNPDIIDDSAKDNNEIYEKLIKISENNKDNVSDAQPLLVSKINDSTPLPEPESEPIPEQVNLSTEETLKKEQDVRGYDRIIDITAEVEKEEKLEKDKSKLDKDKDKLDKDKDKLDKDKLDKELSYIEDVIDDKKDLKEIMSVDKINDDDQETVDLFYDDLKKMSDKKGLSMETVDETKYTLFDDLE